MERRRAAILLADVVGESRLVEPDEASTRTRFSSHREELVHPTSQLNRSASATRHISVLPREPKKDIGFGLPG